MQQAHQVNPAKPALLRTQSTSPLAHLTVILQVAQTSPCLRAGHYILQMQQAHQVKPARPALMHTQPLSQQMLQLGPPLFQLAGLAIGNGLTDPQLQVLPGFCCIRIIILLARADCHLVVQCMCH